MKKAFTLIELLVVIAIIAILAAILFPVFAQAKMAAKKTVSIANQKQIGLGLLMYSADYDDKYPRNDGCTANDSMNDALNTLPAGGDPTPECDGTTSFAFRDNHYSWQKWLQPYVKNKQIFLHPVIKQDPGNWNTSGEIFGGYALNLALTGAMNTYGATPTSTDQVRDSFIGGTQTAVPSPAEAWIVMELASTQNPFVGVFLNDGFPGTKATNTAWPKAAREMWLPTFNQRIGTTGCNYNNTPDPAKIPFGNVVPLSFADGHTKVMTTGDFLAKSPSASDYGITSRPACGLGSGAWSLGVGVQPHWTQPWPLWALN